MINTLFSGFLSVSMKVLDFFLSPISTMIHNSSLHTGFNTFANDYMSLMSMLKNYLPWCVSITGLPKSMFLLVFGVFLAGITLRLSVFILKIVLKWWDRIIA